MDPFTLGAAGLAAVKDGNTAVTGAKNAASGINWAIRKLRLSGKYDPEWLDLGLEGHGLTASEASDVRAFLLSDRAQPILRFVAISMLTPTSDGHNDIKEAMMHAFRSEAERWLVDSKEKWKPSIGLIWDRLYASYQSLIRPLEGYSHLAQEAENYTAFLSFPLGSPVNSGGLATVYLNRMSELASDLDLLFAAQSKSKELAQLIRAAGYAPIINHIDVAKADFNELYVGRHFNDTQTGEILESEKLIYSQEPFRVVLKGTPGAGKSTFVSHFVQALASPVDDATPMPCVVIRCREYVRNAWSSSITTYAVQKLASELSTILTPPNFEAMLLTGQIVAVFDGLDEVTDRAQRAEMVQRIQAFTAQYPPTSVLVTTRTVGYERAPVDKRIFRHLELQEFSPHQVVDYATRWFKQAGRSELRESFLNESKSVPDLRVNPLLLSLLCNLYRSSGEIPTNRREIYEECAQLLFKRWDSHRQIQVHNSMPRIANQLMREIARWFYTTPSAQTGVEERQVAQAIATYMIDDIGMQEDEAKESAKDFLDFCADRAWLLGSYGTNDRNQRLYSFTHRTFFEFFAAEAFARESDSSPFTVAKRIKEAFEADSTSVLPELLIQSYNSVKDRGATHVYQELCKASSPQTPTLLLLRLLDGAVLARYALKAGFDLLVDRWWIDEHHMAPSEFVALLSINSVARSFFVDELLLAPDRRDVRQLFMPLWASYELTGKGRLEERWAPALEAVLASFAEELAGHPDPALINWLLIRGMEAAECESPWEYVHTWGAFGWTGGAVHRFIESALPESPTPAQLLAIDVVHDEVRKGRPVPRGLLDLRVFVDSENLTWQDESKGPQSKLRDILSVLLLAAHEEKLDDGEMEASAHCWPGRIRTVASYRDWKHAVGPQPSLEEKREATRLLGVLPAVVQRWAKGGRYLLEDSRLS